MTEKKCAAVRILVRADDLHALAYCSRGARRWFDFHGLDWREFVLSGLPVEAIEATGDAMALRLAAHVRQRHRVAGGAG